LLDVERETAKLDVERETITLDVVRETILAQESRLGVGMERK